MSETALPTHIAVIMDGNGRWAKSRGLPRREGHRAGSESLRAISERCLELGIRYLTAYAFSSENWSRPAAEVETLMKLLERFLADKTPELLQRGIRLHAIGDLDALPAKVRARLDDSLARTADCGRLTLTLALSYGARADLARAARRLAEQVRDGRLDPGAIDERAFAGQLSTVGLPDPDLLIRTSGEMRISNFLLWEISYAELVIVPENWPDFRASQFDAALAEYQRRQRRFGGL